MQEQNKESIKDFNSDSTVIGILLKKFNLTKNGVLSLDLKKEDYPNSVAYRIDLKNNKLDLYVE